MEDGIKTFPFPTKLDDRIKMIELEFGIKGYAVVWKLHQAIYSVGYYLKWDIDAQLLFIDEYRLSSVGRDCVSEIVASCIRRGVFDSDMYDKYSILTSERIQETFLTAKTRNKKVIVNEDYALPIVYTFIENASKNGKNVNIFFKNDDIYEQKKRKERKGKEIEERKKEIYKNNHQVDFSEMTDEKLTDWINTVSFDFSDESFCALFEQYQEEIKRRRESASFKGKVTKNFLRLESYEEVMDRLNVSDQLKSALNSFLRHCILNGHVVTNEKLEGIIHRLNVFYVEDEDRKIISVKRAVDGGYYDIRELKR